MASCCRLRCSRNKLSNGDRQHPWEFRSLAAGIRIKMKRVRLLLVLRTTMSSKYYRAIRSSLSSAKLSVPFPKDTSWSCPCSYSPSWWGGKLWLRWRAVEWARWANGRRAVQTLTGSRQSIASGPPVSAATRRQITKVKLGAVYQCIFPHALVTSHHSFSAAAHSLWGGQSRRLSSHLETWSGNS